jgi:hypothetical protein
VNTVLMTPLKVANWADYNAGIVGDLQALTDPGADRLLGWDESANAAIGFTVSGALSFSGTDLTCSAAGILAQLLTVDGNGSGLDADLLDGNSSAYYTTITNQNGTLGLANGGTGQVSQLGITRQVTLSWTIQSDPGGTPSGSPGDVFAYY